MLKSLSVHNTLSASKLLHHLRTPLYRNAYAWMFSTGISSALGIVYWVLAARYYTTEVFGINFAVISAMIFLSGVAQLNLMNAMVRFIPRAGAATGRLIGYAYLITILLSALLSAVATFWVGDLMERALGVQMPMSFWFIVATVSWCIFALQDSVLTGLRDAIWVPIENSSYAVAKIILLVALAGQFPLWGIFISWVVPVVVALLPINWLIFRRLLPKHVASTSMDAQPIQPRQIARYVAGNYVGSLFFLASARLLPVLVAGLAGASAGAYFGSAWTIANALKLIITQMTMSLTVEGSRDYTELERHGLRFLRNLMLLFTPCVVALLIVAPYLLHLSGSNYAQEGTAVLRLLALSTLPSTVTMLYLSVARVHNQITDIIVVQAAFSIVVLILSYLLLPYLGIVGVGIAMLTSETLIAAWLLFTRLRPLLRRIA